MTKRLLNAANLIATGAAELVAGTAEIAKEKAAGVREQIGTADDVKVKAAGVCDAAATKLNETGGKLAAAFQRFKGK